MAGASLSGCTTAILTPPILSDYRLWERHDLLDENPLPAPGEAQPLSGEPHVWISRFDANPEERFYFNELWVLPLLPWVDTYYTVMEPSPERLGSDLIDVTINVPAREEDATNEEERAWCDAVNASLREALAAVPFPEERRENLRERMRQWDAGPLEALLAEELRGALAEERNVVLAAHAAPLEVRYELRERFGPRDFCNLVLEQMDGPGEMTLRLSQRDQLRAEPVVSGQPPDGAIIIEGTIRRIDLENRRLLYGLTAFGSDYLSYFGVPQVLPRYALEMVLTARGPEGNLLAERDALVLTERRTGSFWYGYESLAAELREEFRTRVRGELAAFAQDVAAASGEVIE